MQWILYNPIPLRKDESFSVNGYEIVDPDAVAQNKARDHHHLTHNANSDGYNRLMEISPLLPFGMFLVIVLIVIVVIIFRRWPGIVAGITAGALTSFTIYFTFWMVREQKQVYA